MQSSSYENNNTVSPSMSSSSSTAVIITNTNMSNTNDVNSISANASNKTMNNQISTNDNDPTGTTNYNAGTTTTTTSSSTDSTVSLSTRMILSGIAGIGGATICHPLDVIRVHMQTSNVGTAYVYKNTFDAGRHIYRTAGIGKGLYAGISAAYLRQITYGSTRMGLYSYLLEQKQIQNVQNGYNSNDISFSTKFVMGCISGSIGSFIGTPSELALVRMSADQKVPIDQRRNYKNVIDCIIRISTTEGFTKLWRGAMPTVLRATMMSSCSLGITSEAKNYINQSGVFTNPTTGQPILNGYPTMFCSTLISSFFATIACNPFDVIKSRLQNMPINPINGTAMYNGMIDCFIKCIRSEGIMVLYAGFTPAFIKLAPYSIISLTLAEKLTKAITGKDAL